MIFLTDNELDSIISEDIPIYDLTSIVLEISGEGTISFITRQEGIVCGTEEVDLIFKKFGIATTYMRKSSEKVSTDDILISGAGDGVKIHQVWKLTQNLLEYMGGIASLTHKFVSKAKSVNPNISIVTTRKTPPGTKKLTIKSIMAGGAMPHRLSLSDSILIFQEHLRFIGGINSLLPNINLIKTKHREKKIGLEVANLEEALIAMDAGIDIIQFDKASVEILKEAVAYRDRNRLPSLIAAAGGINFDNVDHYARTGVDIIVTTSLYWAKPMDIKTIIAPMEKK